MDSTILLKSPGSPDKINDAAVRAAIKAVATAFGATRIRAFGALDATEAYVFLDLPQRQADHAAFAAAVDKALSAHVGAGLIPMALDSTLAIAGASAAEEKKFLYMVEITAAAANMPAVSEWYHGEHMPGLAAVPGCVHAQRFLTIGSEPVSVACYDFTNSGIRETAAWNAVRGTPWSVRVRPHFLNLKRNMYSPLPDLKLN